MNKTLVAFICLLGLAVAGVPASANPISKKITVSCDSDTADSDGITGYAYITLCDTSDCAGGQQSPCVSATQVPPLGSVPFVTAVCDSINGPVSITVTCSQTFHVRGASIGIGYVDPTGSTYTLSTTYQSTLMGKGFFTTYGGDSAGDNDGDTDTVSVTIK
jgi:hypothetical protein